MSSLKISSPAILLPIILFQILNDSSVDVFMANFENQRSTIVGLTAFALIQVINKANIFT